MELWKFEADDDTMGIKKKDLQQIILRLQILSEQQNIEIIKLGLRSIIDELREVEECIVLE